VKGSDDDLVDGPLDRLELALELTVLGGGDARGDDGSRDVTSASQGSLGFNKDVRNVLLDASDRQHQNYLQKLSRWVPSLHRAMGRCKRISRGSVSAVRMISSAIPRFRVFVARRKKSAMNNMSEGGGRVHSVPSLAPFLSCLYWVAWLTSSKI
jgi:hypothetical protein